jgi:hypothetical protein
MVTETTAVATTAVATKTASNNNANPRPNVQEQPRKANYRQLPLNKHRPSTVYYHSAFTTYSRHNRPENVASTLDVLDTLLKAFTSRARVDSKKMEFYHFVMDFFQEQVIDSFPATVDPRI